MAHHPIDGLLVPVLQTLCLLAEILLLVVAEDELVIALTREHLLILFDAVRNLSGVGVARVV